MKLNLDELIDPWDFTITIDGKDYPTRPATIGDLAALEQIDTLEKLKTGNVGEVLNPAKAFVESLFDGLETPPFRGAAHEWVPIVVVSIMDYITNRAKKNAEAMVKVRPAAGTASLRPASSAPSAGSSQPSTRSASST